MADVVVLKAAAPTAPNTGDLAIYAGTDDRWYQQTSAGVQKKLALYEEVGSLTIYGTQSAPIIVTGAGITVAAGSQLQYVASNGGAVALVLSNGIAVGQELNLEGTSDTDYLVIQTASNIQTNGKKNLKIGVSARLFWGGTKWTVHAANQ